MINRIRDIRREKGMTLVGFSRGDHFTIYAGAERVVPPAAP